VFSLEKAVSLSYAAAIAALIILSGIAYWLCLDEIEAADRIHHTVEVIGSLEAVERSALDVESTARAFLLTGDESDLAQYEAVVPALVDRAELFMGLTRDNPSQQRRAKLLEIQIAGLIGAMEQQVRGKRHGATMSSVLGRKAMRDLRTTISAAADEEGQLLKDRKAARDRSIRLVLISIVALAIMAFALLTVIARGIQIGFALRKTVADRTYRLAYRDSLTGLPNRRMLSDELARRLPAAKADGYRCAVMYLDLDGFKKVNDTLGHAAGDQLLRQVASVLKRQVRRDDVVFRLGGDEFVIVLARIEAAADAEQVAAKVVASLSEPLEIDGNPVNVTTSVGVSIFPDHFASAEELTRAADSALYKAKAAGKGRYVVFGTPAA
jgi:diguanylate cyclase (GGDEF)-like protein